MAGKPAGGSPPEGGWGLIAALKRRFEAEVFAAPDEAVRSRGSCLVCDEAGLREVQSLYKVNDLTLHGVPVVELLRPGRRRQPLPSNAVIYLVSGTAESARGIVGDWTPNEQEAAECKRMERQFQRPYWEAHIFMLDGQAQEAIKVLAGCQLLARSLRTLKTLRLGFSSPETHFFTVGAPGTPDPGLSAFQLGDQRHNAFQIAEGIASALATLGDVPTVRYQKPVEKSSCTAAKLVADALDGLLEKRRTAAAQNGSVILILDRSIDPVVPLLHDFHFQAMLSDMYPSEPHPMPPQGQPTSRVAVLQPHRNRPHIMLNRDHIPTCPDGREHHVKFDDAKRSMQVCMTPYGWPTDRDCTENRYICTVMDHPQILIEVRREDLREDLGATIGVSFAAPAGAVDQVTKDGLADQAGLKSTAGFTTVAAIDGTEVGDMRAVAETWKRVFAGRSAPDQADAPPVQVRLVVCAWRVRWHDPEDGGPPAQAPGGQPMPRLCDQPKVWWDGDARPTKANCITLDDSTKLWCRLRHQHVGLTVPRTIESATRALQSSEWHKFQQDRGGPVDAGYALRARIAFADMPKAEYKRLLGIFQDIALLCTKIYTPWENHIEFEQELACRDEIQGAKDRLLSLLSESVLTPQTKALCHALRSPWAEKHDQEARLRLLLVYICCHGAPSDLGNVAKRIPISQHAVLPDVQCLVRALACLDIKTAKEGLFRKKVRPQAKTGAAQDEAESGGALSRYVPPLKQLTERLLAGDGVDGLPQGEYPYTQAAAGGVSGAASCSAAGGAKSLRPQRRTPALRDPGRSRSPQHRDPQGQSLDGGTDATSLPWSLETAEGPRHYVFVVGGLALSESRAIAEVIADKRRAVIVGSTSVLTPRKYIDDLKALGSTVPA